MCSFILLEKKQRTLMEWQSRLLCLEGWKLLALLVPLRFVHAAAQFFELWIFTNCACRPLLVPFVKIHSSKKQRSAGAMAEGTTSCHCACRPLLAHVR